MQKKIIALAVAGLVSGAAFAQTNVTVYGRADLGYTYSKSDIKKFQGIENGQSPNGGSSYLGVQGEEALGNGLKAIFKFEWGTDIDMATSLSTDRQKYVGLAGGFGQARIGQISSPRDQWMGATGAMGVNGYEAINLFVHANLMPLTNPSRWGNAIAYNSPSFSGVELLAMYSFGEKVSAANGDKISTTDAGRLGLGIKYANGPLYLAANYLKRAKDDTVAVPFNPGTGAAAVAAGLDGAKGWALGGSYDFKVVKLYANYFSEKVDHKTATKNKDTAWSLGVGVPVSSAGTVLAEYAQYKNSAYNGDNKAKGYTVGYKHVLSKRTSLYAYATRVSNDDNISAGWTKTAERGENQTTFTTGIQHLF
ncbi:porin [Betaproteobacteria bacterium]|nr:porin [Betaproteobacteria bacterium]